MTVFSRLHRILQYGWARLLQALGCLWWAERQLRRRGAAVVLTFHRVLDDRQLAQTCSLPGIVLRRRTFDALAGFVAHKYTAVDFESAHPRAGELKLVFTFDDGWKDNAVHAVPVARFHGIPLTIFICPGLIGRTLPFWPERVSSIMRRGSRPVQPAEIERLVNTLTTYTSDRRNRFLASLGAPPTPAGSSDQTACWEDIREMDAAGVKFGCHTLTHEILTGVPPQIARQEIQGAKRVIEAVLHQSCRAFAYPNGGYSRTAQQILSEEGFTAAFTTERGAWTEETHPLAIPRVNVYEDNVVDRAGRFSPAMFQYTVFWKAWRGMRRERRAAVELQTELVSS